MTRRPSGAASFRWYVRTKPGLQRAYDTVVLEHENVADVLSRSSDRMPAYVRSFVQEIIRQAREDAQGMRENRPRPPSGGQPRARRVSRARLPASLREQPPPRSTSGR